MVESRFVVTNWDGEWHPEIHIVSTNNTLISVKAGKQNRTNKKI